VVIREIFVQLWAESETQTFVSNDAEDADILVFTFHFCDRYYLFS